MKTFPIALVFLATILICTVSQDVTPADGDVADGGDASVGSEGQINIETLKCLCGLQANADTSGNVQSSAEEEYGSCGNFGDEVPSLAVDCTGITNGEVSGGFFYLLEIERSSYQNDDVSVTLEDDDDDGYSPLPAKWLKGIDAKNPYKALQAKLSKDSNWGATIYDLNNKYPGGIDICENTYAPGSHEYNLLFLINQMLLDGKGCPIKKDQSTTLQIKAPATIYQFTQQLPCGHIVWTVPLGPETFQPDFTVWFETDIPPTSLCKPESNM